MLYIVLNSLIYLIIWGNQYTWGWFIADIARFDGGVRDRTQMPDIVQGHVPPIESDL